MSPPLLLQQFSYRNLAALPRFCVSAFPDRLFLPAGLNRLEESGGFPAQEIVLENITLSYKTANFLPRDTNPGLGDSQRKFHFD